MIILKRAGLVGVCFANLFLIHPGIAQISQVHVDGLFQDWNGKTPVYQDSLNDQVNGNIDFGRVWADYDSLFIYLRFEVGSEINIQEGQDITLYLDTDLDSTTGFGINNIGAELVYNLGNRSGTLYSSGGPQSLNWAEIFLVSAPTFSSDDFEFSIDRQAVPLGLGPLFQTDSFRMVLSSDPQNSDLAPDFGSILMDISTPTSHQVNPISIKKEVPHSLRFLSYNVLFDNLFDPSRQSHFSNIIQAIDPDIIAFQEIYSHTAAQTMNLVSAFLQSSHQGPWYSAQEGPDNIVVSKFPIGNSEEISGNGVFLIEVDTLGFDKILLVGAHLPCCGNNTGRQSEIDHIMGTIRDLKSGTGPFTLPTSTPLIITGDMNLVGFNQQYNTFITGDIQNTFQYGPPFSPDWNGDDLQDAFPRHLDRAQYWSWVNTGSSFSPGRLDFFIYSKSVITAEKAFALETSSIQADTLTQYGLQPDDSRLASDHVPIIVDFSSPNFTSINRDLPNQQNKSFRIYPNPNSGILNIETKIPERDLVGLRIIDSRGRTIKDLMPEFERFGFRGLKIQPIIGGVYTVLITYKDGGDFNSESKQILVSE